MRYHPTDDPEEVRSHKFVTMETKWAKHIWHECVEQHTFFRLAVPGTPPLPRVLPQLNRDAKYRFSGRTLQQMIKPPPVSPPKSPGLVLSPAPPVHSEGDCQNTTTHVLQHIHIRTQHTLTRCILQYLFMCIRPLGPSPYALTCCGCERWPLCQNSVCGRQCRNEASQPLQCSLDDILSL